MDKEVFENCMEQIKNITKEEIDKFMEEYMVDLSSKYLSGKDMEKLEDLLMDLDVEIGTAIGDADNKDRVIESMINMNKILSKLKEILDIKF